MTDLSDPGALLRFAPDAARVKKLDRRIHAMLSDSLAHLAEATTEDGDFAGRLAALGRQLRDESLRLAPQCFAAYFQTVFHLLTEDLAAARKAAAPLLSARRRPEERDIVGMGLPEASALQSAWKAAGEDMDQFGPVSAGEVAEFTDLFRRAMALMADHLPEMQAEIDLLIRQVLLAKSKPSSPIQFDGASHYQFWGLLVINPGFDRSPLELCEVLAHEASHSLLFGMTLDEPLVHNADDELYPSPLRVDPRPMDGIYHATYVSARMAFAMNGMAQSLPDAADRDWARQAAATDIANFKSGLSVIDEHGRLSDTGRTILEGARAYVASLD